MSKMVQLAFLMMTRSAAIVAEMSKELLVRPRVNHCDLRGFEGAAVVGPAERIGPAVVVIDELHGAVSEVFNRLELSSSE
jgi:hypothetical protein